MSRVDFIMSRMRAHSLEYVAYNVGGMAVGLSRVTIAVIHLFNNWINEVTYHKIVNDEKNNRYHSAMKQQMVRRNENAVAERRTGQAEGFDWLVAEISEATIKTGNFIAQGFDNFEYSIQGGVLKLRDGLILHQIQENSKAWKEEFWRGILEMIPLIGSMIYTVDVITHDRSSILGQAHFMKAVHSSCEIDACIADILHDVQFGRF